MRDIDIRKALHEKLKLEFNSDPDTIIIDEFGLSQGTSRVDIAVINGKIHGYEIKSEVDNLSRLPSQESNYSKVLDKVTIVANSRHIDKIKYLIPNWWGISIAIEDNTKIKINELRKPLDNPNIDPFVLVQLLWKEEVFQILNKLNQVEGLKNKPRRFLWKKLSESIPLVELGPIVRETIKTRESWRFDQLQNKCDDLSLLYAK